MKIISDLQEHYDLIEKLLDTKPDEVFVSSYGLYAGILEDGTDLNIIGPKYKTRSVDVLTKMAQTNSKIIIGITDFKACNTLCPDCELKYIRGLLRIQAHANKFPQIKFKMTRHNHLKCFIVKKGTKYLGITGGRNLSDSSWADISFFIENEDCLKILDIATKIYDKGLATTDESICQLLREQGIEANV